MYHIQKYRNTGEHVLNNGIYDETDNEELWQEKLEEIRTFQREKTNTQLTVQQAEQLIEVYNRYKHVFSNTPGKVRDYQCEIQFREPVNLIKKSYPIAFSLKEAVRTEINRLIAEDIIEPSYSPYTSPVSYTHLSWERYA